MTARTNHTIEALWRRLRTVLGGFGVDSAPASPRRVVPFPHHPMKRKDMRQGADRRRYRVCMEMPVYDIVDVYARSEQHARDIAWSLSLENFRRTDLGDREIVKVSQIPAGKPFEPVNDLEAGRRNAATACVEAAAPELLEACKLAVEELGCIGADGEPCRTCKILQKAIEKATNW